MKFITRTKDGSEEREVFYHLRVRHEIVKMFNKKGRWVATHVTMEGDGDAD